MVTPLAQCNAGAGEICGEDEPCDLACAVHHVEAVAAIQPVFAVAAGSGASLEQAMICDFLQGEVCRADNGNRKTRCASRDLERVVERGVQATEPTG